MFHNLRSLVNQVSAHKGILQLVGTSPFLEVSSMMTLQYLETEVVKLPILEELNNIYKSMVFYGHFEWFAHNNSAWSLGLCHIVRTPRWWESRIPKSAKSHTCRSAEIENFGVPQTLRTNSAQAKHGVKLANFCFFLCWNLFTWLRGGFKHFLFLPLLG